MQRKLTHPLRIIVVMLALLASMSARAYDFEADGIYYDILSEEEGTVAVTDWQASYNGDIVIPSRVTHDSKTYVVTSIGACAFELCSGLTSVTIPDSVTSIGESAFSFCIGLVSVTIGESVASIGENAFAGCIGLTSVTIPSSVTSMGVGAFGGCSGLTEFIVDSANPCYSSVEGVLYSKDLTVLLSCPAAYKSSAFLIPSSITSIGEYAFAGCVGLASVTIPSSVTSIGEHAFHGCSGLTNLAIPASVTSIGEYAFYGCSGLASIAIPTSMTSISGYLFYGCSSLTDVTIPSSVTSIGEYAFRDCIGLMSVTIPDSVTDIGQYAFYCCKGLEGVTIPDSMTSIGEGIFYGCSGLADVTIPDSVTSIGKWAFYGCSGLTSVTIPDSVTGIDRFAFYVCTGITSLTVGSSVTNIGEFAFDGCPLATVYCRSEVAPKGDDFFSESVFAECILYIPKGTLKSYKRTNPWSRFKNIVETEFSGVEEVGETDRELKIAVKDGAVNVEGCAGNALIEVYSLNGTCVYRGSDTRITGLTHGIYLVRVGAKSQKVMIKG